MELDNWDWKRYYKYATFYPKWVQDIKLTKLNTIKYTKVQE